MLIVIPNASWAHFDGLHKTSLFAYCEPLKQILDRNICFLLKGSKNSKRLHLCTHTYTHTHAHMHMRTLIQMHAYTHTYTTNIHNRHAHTHLRTVYSDDRVHWQRCAKPVAINAFGSQFLEGWGNPTFFLIQSGGLSKTVGLFVGVLGPYLRMDSQYFQQNRRITICTGQFV